MANSRIRGLAGEVLSAQIQALLDTLYFAVDETNFTDAKKILLKSILTDAVVEANTNNYQALTPKGFYDSVMTNTRKGIGQISQDAAVTAKTGSDLLTSVHQVLMQAQWRLDFFKCATAGTPGYAIITDTGDLATASAVAYQAAWTGQLGPSNNAVFTPPFPAGKAFKHVYCQIMVTHGNVFSYGSYVIQAPGAGGETDIGIGANTFIWLYDNGKGFGVAATVVKNPVKIAITVNGTLQNV